MKEAWVLSEELFRGSFLFALPGVGREGKVSCCVCLFEQNTGEAVFVSLPQALTQNCFLDPSVVKSENVLRTITQANTMSQDKYALLAGRPELK